MKNWQKGIFVFCSHAQNSVSSPTPILTTEIPECSKCSGSTLLLYTMFYSNAQCYLFHIKYHSANIYITPNSRHYAGPLCCQYKRLLFAIVGCPVQKRIWYKNKLQNYNLKKVKKYFNSVKIDVCWTLTRHFIQLWHQHSISNCGKNLIFLKFSNIWFYNHCEFITKDICLNMSNIL